MKKALSILLAVLMVMTMLPISTLAEEETVSGDCGNGIVWTYYLESGKLTVLGSGAISDYKAQGGVTTAPWGKYASEITEIVFGEDIFSIGQYAFYGLTAIEEITVPETVTSIGRYAFGGGSAVKTMTLPFVGNAVSTSSYLGYIFGAGSFSNNANYVPATLKTVRLLDSCTILANGSFYGCANIEHIYVPDTVVSVTSDVFTGCDSLQYNTYNNARYLGNEQNPYVVLMNVIDRSVSAFTIYPETKVIYAYAFEDCSNLRSIELPYWLKSIANYAFQGCNRLYLVKNNTDLSLSFGSSANGFVANYATVIINKDGTKTYKNSSYYMDDEGFVYQVNGSKYTLVSYTGTNDTITLPLTVEGSPYTISYFDASSKKIIIPKDFPSVIGENAFRNNISVKSVVISDGLAISIGSYAFSGCTALEDVYIGDAVTSIGSYSFYNCTSLKEIVIPDSVTVIYDRAFYGCTSLQNVTLSNNLQTLYYLSFGNTAIEEIKIPKSLSTVSTYYNSSKSCYYNNGESYINVNNGPFSGRSLKTVTFEEGTTVIPQYLFAVCTNLENVTIPDTVTSIGNYAFAGCSAFKNLTLPKSLTDIGIYAFSCTAIEEVEIPKKTVKVLDEYSPFCCNEFFKAVTFECGITSIPAYLFRNCFALKSVVIPDTVTSLGIYAFSGCTALESAYIGDAVTDIGSYAFNGCTALEDVYIGDAVTSIGSYSFYNCTSLKEIVIPDSVTVIYDRAFYGCTSLHNVTLSNNLQTLYYLSFGNTAIEEIKIPKSLSTVSTYYNSSKSCYYNNGKSYINVNNGPFSGSSLKTVTFEEGTTVIPQNLFAVCTNLENFTLPATVTSLGNYAFAGCSGMKSVSINNIITTIPEYCFAACTSLNNVVFGNSVNIIDNDAFFGCSGLTEMQLPNQLTAINSGAFASTALESVVFPTSLTTIGNSAFSDCLSLTGFSFSNNRSNLKSIGSYAFQNCDALKTIIFPSSLTSIGSYAFSGCNGLEKFKFSNDKSAIESIGSYAFQYCTELTEAVLPSPLNSIGSYAFYMDTALETVSVPYSCRTLGAYAFYGCEKLKNLSIADYSVTTIPEYCFFENMALESVVIPKGCTTIANNAFKNCTKLFNITLPASVKSIGTNVFSYPKKTTIFGKSGTYAQTFAKNGGFTFVDNAVPTTGIALASGVEEITLECGESFYAVFDYEPENTSDVIWMTSNNNNVSISMHQIISNYAGDSIITIHTTTGVENTFVVHNISVKNITLTSLPNIRNYDLNETLDLTGLIVKVNYSNGTSKEVTDYTVSGFDSKTEGTKTVTISWVTANGTVKTATFTVSVVDRTPRITGIYVAKQPDKLVYNKREPLDITGLVIMASYDTANDAEITDYKLGLFNTLKVGEQTITVTAGDKYGTFTTDFTVTVVADHEHIPSTPIVTKPTCTEVGYSRVYCTKCGELISETEIAETGHTRVDDIGYAATCHTTGLSDGAHCSVCGEVLIEQQILPKTKHQYVSTVIPATYWEQGYTLHTCSICHSSYKDDFTTFGGELDQNMPVIKVFDTTARRGNQFTVDVCIANNPGINAMALSVQYDSSKLSLIGAENAVGEMCQFAYVTKAIWLFGSDTYYNGKILTLTFEVSDGAEIGETEIGVTYQKGDICDKSENNVMFATVSGKVSVVEYVAGDINGDDLVNSKDLSRLIRYLSGEKVAVNEAALDVNGDGACNSLDLTRLLNYLAGEDVEIY